MAQGMKDGYTQKRQIMDNILDIDRIDKIIESITRVAKGDYSVQLELSGKNDELDSIAMGINIMIDDLAAGTVGLDYVNNRIEEIVSVIQKVARGDYTVACELSSKNDIFDALGIGINMMIDDVWNGVEELEAANEELRVSEEELRAANEELQASEEELRATNEELEAANEELREAQEQVIRSERLAAIGQLAGGVGHELRNPLGAIKNAIYYIKGKVANSELAQKEPRVVEFLDIVDEEVNSSTKIINDLLGFSRVGKPAISPARIEMVIDDALSYVIIPENIEMTEELAADLPEVEMDTDQIRQVLVNIISNAVQAMPEGGKMTIAARRQDNFLEVDVCDTGSGMSEEVMGKVFDPLFTTRAKGIGLGLAVCKAIVDRHEGHIEIESEAGKGTTFTLRLPLIANQSSSDTGGE